MPDSISSFSPKYFQYISRLYLISLSSTKTKHTGHVVAFTESQDTGHVAFAEPQDTGHVPLAEPQNAGDVGLATLAEAEDAGDFGLFAETENAGDGGFVALAEAQNAGDLRLLVGALAEAEDTGHVLLVLTLAEANERLSALAEAQPRRQVAVRPLAEAQHSGDAPSVFRRPLRRIAVRLL